MNEPKFTKERWVVGDYNENTGLTEIRSTGNRRICKIEFRNDEDDFNALLIAAAPEMYEMLHGIAQEAELFEQTTGSKTTWLDGVNALLAKARGEN